MTTTKKTYVRPEIVEYEIQPCVPLATSPTKEDMNGESKDGLSDDKDLNW